MTLPDLLNEIPHCCSSCEHLYKTITEEPCCFCGSNNNGHHDKWTPNDYVKSVMKEAN